MLRHWFTVLKQQDEAVDANILTTDVAEHVIGL